MFNITKKSIEWAGKTLEIEVGRFARQADGAVFIKYGNTTLLCTAVAAKEPKEGIDFFPLTVHYQEKAFAAGKIPGGFFKREGKPSEREVLISRLIDRPIRPLFEDNFYNETQVVCTLLSYDMENDSDVPAMVGASAALAISGIPLSEPIGAARVGFINGEYIMNPTLEQLKESTLDLVLAGTESSVMMVESEAKELSEEQMLGAVTFGHKEMQPVIELINELAKECGKKRWEIKKKDTSAIAKRVKEMGEAKFRAAYRTLSKQERVEKLSATRKEIVEAFKADAESKGEVFDKLTVNGYIKKLEKDIVRWDILDNNYRIDGRDCKKVRQIDVMTNFLPQTHGSALFTRGETQALVVTTLGTAQDEQRIDALEGDTFQHFLLHYNFPPFSVGEATPMRPPGRREIGHGKLAWRALRAVLPQKEEFPYTIRIVSEITESNGSSSMATVCGSSLSLMDAGVPIKSPVAGIAMGLIKEGEKFAVLSDILGDEDHLGDMDFKVAGTADGVTSLQMDIKINGITQQIMDVALRQAKEGRNHILGRMNESLSESRGELKESAPKITTITIPKEKIREVIGSGGSVIRDITEKSGAKIDIQDDGTVTVAAVKGSSAKTALDMIANIVAEPEIGAIYDGTVARVVDFGAFVTIMGKTDGLVHISEMAPQRVEKVTDVVNEGDKVKVKVLEMERGKIRLSMKAVDQATGEPIAGYTETPRGDRGDRPRRDDRPRRGDRDERPRRRSNNG
jgi:polyribonucleotide nucleotidyltransferase